MEDIEHLKAEIARKKSDLEQLEARLAAAEAEHTTAGSDGLEWKWPLASQDYQRYSRQMIVPGFGLEGITTLSHLLLCYIPKYYTH